MRLDGRRTVDEIWQDFAPSSSTSMHHPRTTSCKVSRATLPERHAARRPRGRCGRVDGARGKACPAKPPSEGTEPSFPEIAAARSGQVPHRDVFGSASAARPCRRPSPGSCSWAGFVLQVGVHWEALTNDIVAPRPGDRQPDPDPGDLSGAEGRPRARARLRHEALRRRGTRGRRDVPRVSCRFHTWTRRPPQRSPRNGAASSSRPPACSRRSRSPQAPWLSGWRPRKARSVRWPSTRCCSPAFRQ